MTSLPSRISRLGTMAGAILVLSACTESVQTERPLRLDAPRGVEAQLVASNAAPTPGENVVVLVRLLTGASVRPVASFTARFTYDTTRLVFEGEEPLGGEGTRVLNPASGEVRVAGIASAGFHEGELVALRFKVLAAAALTGTRVEFDELHAAGGEDLSRVVSAPPAVDARLLK